MASLRLLGRRLFFAPQHHLWMRISEAGKAALPACHDDDWHVQIGMTQQGLDHVGDVLSVQLLAEGGRVGTVLQEGGPLVELHWEGFEQSEADELYHTVWESMEGTESIRSPLTGRVVAIANAEQEEVDEETALVEMICGTTDLRNAMKHWVDEQAYRQFVRKDTPGKFSSL